MTVPIVSQRSVKQFNEVWRGCRKINQPMIVIEKRRKYATITYDMHTCNCNLVPEAVNKIQKIFNDFAIHNKDRMEGKAFIYGCGETYGYLPDVYFSLAMKLAKEIDNIIMNPINHCHCLNYLFSSEKCPH